MDALCNDCYQMYENDMNILEVSPGTIVNQMDPQKIVDAMKEKAFTKVCSISKISSRLSCVMCMSLKMNIHFPILV